MDQIDELLSRRVEKILPSKAGLEAVLRSGKKLRLYQGFDPTGSRLHLGHTIGLRKLMEFANLGHEVIFLFGTGTVLVGDPSQRNSARKLITPAEITQNIKDWQKQVEPLVDFSKIKILQNGDWLTKLTLKDIIAIASNISAVQLFKRDMFRLRLEKGNTVWYHETLYPLLQGYDSVVMDVDLEVGGTDQEFNMLIGRELLRKMKDKEKFVLTVPMIMGTDDQPMSKTSGNCIWLDDTPENMFGKLMSLGDEQIIPYMKFVTDLPLSHIETVETGLASHQIHPLDAKKELAVAVVSELHSAIAAKKAETYFATTIQQKTVPTKISAFTLKPGKYSLLDICQKADLGFSNSQIKRTIEQGGVEWNSQKITNPLQLIEVQLGDILKFGKRTFKKVQF